MNEKKSQLFKQSIDYNFIVKFIQENFVYDELKNNYLCDNECFKKLLTTNEVCKLYKYLRDTYHLSKLHYIENIFIETGFYSVMRQVAKHIGIKYSYKIKYSMSKYKIIYHFEIPIEI